MLPTLHHRDRVVVIKHWPVNWLRKGMIVIVQAPIYYVGPNKHTPITLIKRVAGLPGDLITLEVANAIKLPDWHQDDDIASTRKTLCIKPGYLFLRGDSGGTDSNMFGPIPYSSLIGVVVLRLWNASDRNEKMGEDFK